MLERGFDLAARGATPAGEVRGGLTTFMVTAYIIFVNPAILSMMYGAAAAFVVYFALPLIQRLLPL